MFVDDILNVILRPFRELFGVANRVSGVKGGIQMDIQRVRGAPQQVRGEMANAVSPLVQGGRDAANWRGQSNQPQPGQPSPQAAQPSQKKKMSWWPWSKKTCIRCNQKLHKSWDQCPYCGQSQSAPVLAGGPQGGAGGGMPAPYGQPAGNPYGAPPMGAGPMPTPGGPQKTIAMDAVAINAPLLATGDRGENVAWLVPLDGALTGELLEIKTRAIIGSTEGCDVRLFDAAISGRHAEITLAQNGRYRITDLGSRNGSYVNDKAIASIELVDGDNIRLGRTTFRFKTKA